tara:strand:+ start:204 stop:437 length:234 start_codon:yes stop_codon:yes gene_type:complete
MGYIGGFKVFEADAEEIQDLIDWNTQSFGRGAFLGDTTYEVFQDGSEVLIEVYGSDAQAFDMIYYWVEDEGHYVSEK